MSKKVDFLIRMLLLVMLIMELYFMFIQGKHSVTFTAVLLTLIVGYDYIKKENHRHDEL